MYWLKSTLFIQIVIKYSNLVDLLSYILVILINFPVIDIQHCAQSIWSLSSTHLSSDSLLFPLKPSEHTQTKLFFVWL